MNNVERHRLKVLADPTICHICEKPALPGTDEFGGHTCPECRKQLAEARKRLALQGAQGMAYTELPPRSDTL